MRSELKKRFLVLTDLMHKVIELIFLSIQSRMHTVNICQYKTIGGNGNTVVIPTTSKSIILYREFQFQKMVIYLKNSCYRPKDLLVVGMTPVFPLASIVL